MNDHARWEDVAGAYVLDAMPADERQAFEQHLVACEVCQAEVDELLPAAEALPMASPPMVPPPALRDRIMAEVEREAALLAETGAGADRPQPARRERRERRGLSWLSGWRLAPVAAALLIAGVLAGGLLTADGSRTIDFEGEATAQLEVDGDRATLVAEDMPAPPEGRVYEVWLMPEGSETPQPTDVLFTPRSDGSAVAAIPGSVEDVSQVLITDEPLGGSDEPTGELLMSAELS
jgi:anti-sigma-K factor RskA